MAFTSIHWLNLFITTGYCTLNAKTILSATVLKHLNSVVGLLTLKGITSRVKVVCRILGEGCAHVKPPDNLLLTISRGCFCGGLLLLSMFVGFLYYVYFNIF